MSSIIIYFGIGRGGKIAFDYYNDRFDNNIETQHFYINQKFVSSQRSGESFCVGQQRVPLSSIVHIVDDIKAEKFIGRIDFSRLNDIYGNSHQSTRNLIKQLFLLNEVIKKLNTNHEEYIFIRDDTVVDFKQSIFQKLRKWDNDTPRILVPVAHWHGGICDRFFITNRNGMKRMSERLDFTLRELFGGGMSSEVIFKKFLLKQGFRVYSSFIGVRRIRSGSHIIRDRYFIPVKRPNELISIIVAYFRFIFKA